MASNESGSTHGVDGALTSDMAVPTECEKEPIHIPGSIQPFGILMTAHGPGLLISNASLNCGESLGLDAAALIGRSFLELVPERGHAALHAYLKGDEGNSSFPYAIELVAPVGQRTWILHAHTEHEETYLELEPVDNAWTGPGSTSTPFPVHAAAQALHAAGNVQELCAIAASQIHRLTGFDRVMIYRFDKDWHGEVIAEARHTQADSYLGHHFPASDIPAQARAVFLKNWVRMIPDATYRPVPIYPDRQLGTQGPLDLGRSLLRSVSPVHLQYLANMDVGASLTLSLIDGGNLWGLIACHHAGPHYVDPYRRLDAQLIAQVVSGQLRSKSELSELAYREKLAAMRAALARRIEAADDVALTLTTPSPSVLDIAGAKGAAVVHGRQHAVAGATPPAADIDRIVDWLATVHADKTWFHTESLSETLPEAIRFKDVASGLLALAISPGARHYVLLFRPEVAATITWAGRPEKLVRRGKDNSTLLPRESFRSWQEIVSGKSEAWNAAEIEAALNLRTDILAQALHLEYARESAARREAERVGREKDEIVMMVSHDLKTPLNIMRLGFEFLQQFSAGLEPAAQRMITRGVDAADLMELLIRDVLDMSKVEAGILDLQLQVQDAESIILNAVDFMMPIAVERGITLEAQVRGNRCLIRCERPRIHQVLENLIGNALKFTPAGGMVVAEVEGCGSNAVFSVRDNGPGIPAEHLPHVFDRFWQARETRRFGSGLGLAIAKGIIEKHGGRIWVESSPNEGARFYFTVPATGNSVPEQD